LLLILFSALTLPAQNAVLKGTVTDQSGAFVPGATVLLTGSDGLTKTAIAGADGGYIFNGLIPGEYTLHASAPQLVLEKAETLTIRSGVQTLNPRLSVASITQQIVVDENPGPAISTDAASNATATVLRGDDLDTLSDSPEDLQADLEALAGPSAGPGGSAIFIDGFSSGDLPAKEAIREVRINQNPFSPEFDKLGLGRIEIFTKPGSDKYHGSFGYNFANQFWNSRNPYSALKAPLSLNEFENTFRGPAGKRASFAVDASQHDVDNGSIINAVTLLPGTLQVTPLLDTFRTVQRRTRLAPRVDYQIDENNTVTLRYGFIRGDIDGAGIGGFNLTEHGIHTRFRIQTAQVVETSVHGSTVNETRFQFYRNASEMRANSAGPEIRVLGSFTGGGSPLGDSLDTLTNFELHNNTTSVHGAHTVRFGLRARHAIENSIAPQGFNGTFTFTGGLAPALDANNQIVFDASRQPIETQITSIERYRRTKLFQSQGLTAAEIAARGGGPAQFTIATGTPGLTVRRWDVGVFAGDDWRLRPNLTLNLGIRYENQTNIHDPRDLAPRIGVAWAPGSGANNPRPKLVVRAGFGIFYDRFLLMDTLTAARYNGIVQQQYVIPNPDFFPDASKTNLAAFQSEQVIQQVSPALRAPYIVQSAITLERQLPANTTVAVTYNNSRGFRELRSRDANAPLPNTYDPANPSSGVFPLGHPGPLFMVESAGIFRQNQLSVNVNSKVSPTISLFGSYVFGDTMSDTEGAGTFPANPYDLRGEYAPSLYDIRHRVHIGGSVNTKWNVRVSPLIVLQSGPPFDITAGSDLYGTSLFNARPGIATDPSKPGVIFTSKYGWLDPNPSPDEALLPRNFGRGPGQMYVNLRIAKVFGFGAERKPAKSSGGIFAVPAERHYSMTLALGIRNLLNHRNPGQIIGNITSPLFGQANQMAGNSNGEGFSENANNRRLELQIRLAF
jgi:hypothetical protein